jgi:uncharacterized protein YdaU (DUF1376 family)
LSAGKNDIWMPLYIGDYLADTMHLNTQQHGAYLLLLFHLWRRGSLPNDDTALAKITGLTAKEWYNARLVLEPYFKVNEGFWQHNRVERERIRIAARQERCGARAKTAARKRWDEHAPSMTQALLLDAIPEPEPDTKTETNTSSTSRHGLFRSLLAEYWGAKNHTSPEMPWQGRDAKALSDLLAASPHLTEEQFRGMLANRARSPVAHGDRVYLWIANITRYQEEMTVYNRPASAGGHGSRAEINCDSVRSAVNKAWDIARGQTAREQMAEEHAAGTGQTGDEPAGFTNGRVLVADG